MRKPVNVTLAWHVGHVLLALAGLIGNLAYRRHYVETSRELANAAQRRA